MAKSSFQLSNPLETRMNEATRIREKYPDRVSNIIRKTTIRLEIKYFQRAHSHHIRPSNPSFTNPTIQIIYDRRSIMAKAHIHLKVKNKQS
ncbi:hypothetical protein YC2023_040901 [Brassica napus]